MPRAARRPSPARLLAVALLLVAAVATAPAHAVPAPEQARRAPQPPNIVFVLTDDLTSDLLAFMPTVRAMQREGTSFSRYVVSDSLCCSSRASILTGQFPHSTGVRSNVFPTGGWRVFKRRGGERSTFATDLQRAGYRTGLLGKYLNEYRTTSPVVPPGWDTWAATSKGYHNYDYRLNVDGRVKRYGHRPADYLTDVVAERGEAFLDEAATDPRPFFLEVSTFAPHGPATPAPGDRGTFAGLQAPRTASFDQPIADGPSWLTGREPLTPAQVGQLDERFQARAESVLAVDRMLARLRARLDDLGLADDTYVVFSSDNGFHLGEHRLMPGKMTAFDSDVRVPLIATGPGVPHGRVVDELAQNVDLRPTFDELAGAPVPRRVEGSSLAGLLHGVTPSPWRRSALIEHLGPETTPDDPDYQSAPGGNPVTYTAIRTSDNGLYVESTNGEREYYELGADPEGLTNVFKYLSPEFRAELADRVARLRDCRGAQCVAAGR